MPLNSKAFQEIEAQLSVLSLLLMFGVTCANAQPIVYVGINSSNSNLSSINAATNTVVATVPLAGVCPQGLAITPDGTLAYVTGECSNAVSVINTATGTVVATVPVGDDPSGVAITPDGTRAYVANAISGTVSVINTATNTVVATVTTGSPYRVAITPDGTRVYVTNGNYPGTVSVIDTATNTVVATVPVGDDPVGIAITPDGTRAYVANYGYYGDPSASVINTATNTVTATVVPVGAGPAAMAITPDGTRAYMANESGTVSVINTATNTVVATVAVGAVAASVAITPDGTLAYVGNAGDGTVSVINTATNTVVATVTVGGEPTAVAIAPLNPPSPPPTSFDDEFSSGTLDPAWVLAPGCGAFSVTANPGFLQHGLVGCSSGVAGAELFRQFTGSRWTFDTKVTYSMPAGGGQNLYLNLFFGPPSTNTFVTWLRHRDDGYAVNDLELNLIDGGATLPGGFGFGLGPPPCPADTCFLRITRVDQQVTVLLSSDGVNFTTLDSQTFTTNLGNLQTVLLVGSSFSSSSAYADYDYMRAAPAASMITPTVSFTGAPASAAYQSMFTVSATTNASTVAVITATGACTISGNTVTMSSGTGTCSLAANWAADQHYLAASANQSTIATKATATVSLNAASLSQTYDGTPKSVTASTNPAGLSVNFTYNGSNTAPMNAGTYSVIATVSDPNYQGTVSGTLQVNKTTLKVSANSTSRTYGAPNPTFSANYSGFVNGDNFATAVTGSPSLTTTATQTSLPGTYPIVAAQGSLLAANYTFSFVNGALTVTTTGVAPASGGTCNGAYTGTFNGNVTLSSGQTCVFVSGGITGNVALNGNNLVLSNATAAGSVQGQGNLVLSNNAHVKGNVTLTGGQLSLGGGSSIAGNLTLSGGSSLAMNGGSTGGDLTINGGGTFSIGPSTSIGGNLTIQSVLAGAAQSQVCGTTVKGNVTVQNDGVSVQVGSANSSSCAGNVVTGNLQLQQNTGSLLVFDNTVTGNLQCQNNSSISGMGNTAKQKQGQCTGF